MNCTKQRDLLYTFKAVPVLYEHVPQTQSEVLCQHSDTSLKVYFRNKMDKIPYSSSFVLDSMYEIKTASPTSNKVAIRFSSKVKWLNKPFIGASMIEGHFDDIMKENFEYFKEWAPSKVKKMRSDHAYLH